MSRESHVKQMWYRFVGFVLDKHTWATFMIHCIIAICTMYSYIVLL